MLRLHYDYVYICCILVTASKLTWVPQSNIEQNEVKKLDKICHTNINSDHIHTLLSQANYIERHFTFDVAPVFNCSELLYLSNIQQIGVY